MRRFYLWREEEKKRSKLAVCPLFRHLMSRLSFAPALMCGDATRPSLLKQENWTMKERCQASITHCRVTDTDRRHQRTSEHVTLITGNSASSFLHIKEEKMKINQYFFLPSNAA